MINVDDYVTGHEDDITRFDFEGFKKDITKWHDQIKEDLKKEPYDMTLLCVNAVLDSVDGLIYDNTEIYNPHDIDQQNLNSETIDYSKYTFLNDDLTSVPDACRNCSQHPSNGGSGVCHCTLGSTIVY